MPKAKLSDFFEASFFGSMATIKGLTPDSELRLLTWEQLSEVAFMAMLKDNIQHLNEGVLLGAFAIQWLTIKALESKIEIF